MVSTNPGAVVKVLPAPPKEFNAQTALAQELERYGLPPKPDQIRDAKSGWGFIAHDRASDLLTVNPKK